VAVASKTRPRATAAAASGATRRQPQRQPKPVALQARCAAPPAAGAATDEAVVDDDAELVERMTQQRIEVQCLLRVSMGDAAGMRVAADLVRRGLAFDDELTQLSEVASPGDSGSGACAHVSRREVPARELHPAGAADVARGDGTKDGRACCCQRLSCSPCGTTHPRRGLKGPIFQRLLESLRAMGLKPPSGVDLSPRASAGEGEFGLSEAKWRALAAEADMLRKLVRIKLADDNDLLAAREALVSCDAFFRGVASLARRRQVEDFVVFEALQTV